ncbi:MAG: hypothetical protein FK731_03135 [Asgard group archaeon]|nr:hypothetical protein [Asgard group archaeon]
MSRSNACEIPSSEINQQIETIQTKEEDNCLICRLMRIRHERLDIVKWIYSSKKPNDEKARLATMMTGITFDKDLIDCLKDPSIKKFILSE